MSIKDLFNNYKSNQFSPAQSELSASKLAESTEHIQNKFVEKFRYEPPIDFTTASNFAKFGSAELYYEYAFKRIYQQYPYDGTLAEQQEFHNNSTFLDKYIFDQVYPRTTGHIKFSSEGWGTRQGSKVSTYGLSNNVQYISVLGGPHTASGGMEGKELTNTFDNSMIYDESKNRVGSFEWNPTSGSTIEFWLKKAAFDNNNTEKEVILDIWNGEVTGSTSYGRITLELSNTNALHPILLTMRSGSDGFDQVSIATGSLQMSNIIDNNWHHYAISIENINSTSSIDLYRDGTYLKNTTDTNTIGSIKNVTGGVNAYIGSLQTAVTGTATAVGWGKLSASLDEFRYWKKKRTTNEIGEYWFVNMGGGTNKREYNTDLGVYFKFNEGITGISTTDQNILDYSGRISNGIMVGYNASARSTESAFESLTNVEEFKDPIIYSSHPTVSSSLVTYKTTGSIQDYENTSLLYNLFPSWIVEEDYENGQNLRYLTQIMASYFDTLNAQISGITEFKNKRYFSGSMKPNTYAREILRGQGFVIPDIFIEADVLEEIRGKDDNETYNGDIQKVKNLIYQNIYNNLNYIYKSKGTEKSFRNLFRCFGVDSELLKLNLYSNDSTYLYKDNYEFASIAKPVLNLNKESQLDGTVYLSSSSGLTYLSSSEGNDEEFTSMTFECEAIFPYKFEKYETGYFPTPFTTASIAGFHRALTSSTTDFTWHSDDTDLRIYALKQDQDSRHVKFLLTGSGVELTSSLYRDVYYNNKWILAARVKRFDYPFAGSPEPSSILITPDPTYIVELYGVNSVANDVKNEFLLTASVSNTIGKNLLGHTKRIYAGSHRQNFTGSSLQDTDVKISQVRYWQSHLSNDEIKEHSYDPTNYGLIHPYRSDAIFQISGSEVVYVPQIETLALHWDFMNITSSDSSGEFIVSDISSGSTSWANEYSIIGKITKNKYDGYAEGFDTSSVNVVDKEFIYTAKKRLPDEVYSSDGVKIKTDMTENFFEDDAVADNFYMFEKSPYNAVSQQMINFFGSMKDFNSLVGDPAERYRFQYKQMEDLKRLFFERVENIPDPERFFEYFKWIDTSISYAISQLIPASSQFAEDVKDIVESHILERNKYQEKFPLVAQQRSTMGVIKSFSEISYKWQFGHAPLDGSDNKNCLWQKIRRKINNTAVQTLRDNIYKTSNAKLDKVYDIVTEQVYEGNTDAVRRLSRPYKLDLELKQNIHGGTNYYVAKNRDFVLDVVHPHGETTSDGVPKNVLVLGVGEGQGIIAETVCEDEENNSVYKEKYNFDGIDGRFSSNQTNAPISDFSSYKNFTKGIATFPFNIMSQSTPITTGYQKLVVEGFESSSYIANLHSDTTDRTNAIPMQGPFTERHVGGHQSRHISINKYDTTLRDDDSGTAPDNNLHNLYTRPEAWRLLIDDNPSGSIKDGALGFTPPDYGVRLGSGVYPDIAKKRASYYREEKAKRPVNIKNIKHRESGSVVGNYNNNYEFLLLQGRRENNLYHRDNPEITNYLPIQYTASLPHTTHVMSLVGIDPVLSGNVWGTHANNMQPDAQLITPAIPGTAASGSFKVSGSTISGQNASGSFRLNRQITAATPARFSFNVSGSHYAGTAASGSFSFTRSTVPAASASIQFIAKGRTIEQVESSGSFVVTASHVAGTFASGSFNVKRPPYYNLTQGTFRVKSKDFVSDTHKITIVRDPSGTPVTDILEIDTNGSDTGGQVILTGSSITDFYDNVRDKIIATTDYNNTFYSATNPTYGIGVFNDGNSTNTFLSGTFSAQHWPALSSWSTAFWIYVSGSNSKSGLIFTEYADSSFNSDHVRNIFLSDNNEIVYRKHFEETPTGYAEWSGALPNSALDKWSHITISQQNVSSQTAHAAIPTVEMRINSANASLTQYTNLDFGNITAIPTGSRQYSLYSDGTLSSSYAGLDEFGLWSTKLENTDDQILQGDGLYVARSAVSSSQLRAWWRLGDDENITGDDANFDIDRNSSLSTGDFLEEQVSNQHATASINGTDLYFENPSIYETSGSALVYVRTTNTGSNYEGTISITTGTSFFAPTNITRNLVTQTSVVVQDGDSITLSGSVFELDSNSSISGDHQVSFTTNQNKTDFWNSLSASIKTNTDFDTITITDHGNNATFSLTSSTLLAARNGDITTESGTSFSSLVSSSGGSSASGATDGHAITIDGITFQLDTDSSVVDTSSLKGIDCPNGTSNTDFWNALSQSIKDNTDFDTITITDNSDGTATFSLTASTGGDSNNGVISTTGSPSSFPSFVQAAGGVDQSGSVDGQSITLRASSDSADIHKFIVESSDGSQVDNTPAGSFYVDSSVATDAEYWNNLTQSIKSRGFDVSYSAGTGQATFTVTTYKTGSSGNVAGGLVSFLDVSSFGVVSSPFKFSGGKDITSGNEENKITIGSKTFEMDSDNTVTGSNVSVVSSGSLTADQVFNNLTASIKTHTNFDTITITGTGNTRTLSLTSSVVGTAENGKITSAVGGFGSLVATAGGTNTSGSQYGDTLVIGNHGSNVTITVRNGSSPDASLTNTSWWNDLSQSIKTATNYDTISITNNGNNATFMLTSSVTGIAGNDTHSETGTTFFNLVNSQFGTDAGDSSDGSRVRINDGVNNYFFVLDSDGTYSGDFNIPSSASLSDDQVFNALTKSIKDNTLFDTITMTPSSGNNRIISITSSVSGSNKNSAFSGFSGDISLVSQTTGGSNASGSTDGDKIIINGITFELDNNSSVTNTSTLKGINCSNGIANVTFWNTLSQSIKDNTVYDTISYTSAGAIATFHLTSSTTGSVLNVPLVKTGSSFSALIGMHSGSDFIPAVYTDNDVVLAVPTPTLQNGDQNKTIISSRFAAPGGIEIESNAYLDVYARELSVHNALPFRNLTVRGSGSGESGTIRVDDHLGKRRGLNTLLALHSGQFGIDSTYGSIVGSIYSKSGSFNKQHRNRSKRMEYSGSSIITGSLFDNAFVSTPIPRSEFQYSWIRNSLSASGYDWEADQKILGYQSEDGFISSSAGYVEAIVFPSSSNIT